MFNVTVINVKKSTRYMAFLLITLILIYGVTKGISNIKTKEILKVNISEKVIKCLFMEIPAIESTFYKSTQDIKEDNEEESKTLSVAEKILRIELAKIENKKEQKLEQVTNEDLTVQENKIDEQVPSNEKTQVVTKNPIAESFNMEFNGVKIKNETSFEISSDTNIEIDKKNIVIFHTHTCESYTPSEQYPYQQTGNFRTTDLNYTVSRVGDELTNHLIGYGFNVIHDKTYHDYPAYTGSYTRSNATVESILKNNKSDIIIDLHRDAIGSKSNYDPSVKIGDDVAAQLMFVIGTNGGGLYHPNWKENFKFAMKVQQKANEMYPGLFKPIILRNSRYNQHLGKAACIIEVGSTGNTLEQCLNSMKYLSKVLEQI